jgi:hypothetical protein
MGTFLLMTSLVCSAPSTVGLLIVDHAAAATPELHKAARAQVQKLTHDANVEVRATKFASVCNLDGFYQNGVNFEQCRITMPKNLGKLYVVELRNVGGKVEATVAYFDRNDFIFPFSYASN